MLLLLLGSTILSCLIFIHPHFQANDYELGLAKRKHLVRELHITDLCLLTEARYTRHPSQADLNSPFQDYPTAFEHFPSGSLMTPPRHLMKRQSSVVYE